jgi:hypothetical protein
VGSSESIETAPAARPTLRSDGARRVTRGFGGGIDGNEQLTAMTGVILLFMLAVLGVTIVRIGQLMWLHLFLGLLLLGPVALKLGSTGYRFLRYYTRAAIYRAKGPPMPALRTIGPFVVLSTLVVFASGIVLLLDGPARRATPLLIHKASFIVWLLFMGLHVLAHLPGLPRSLRAVRLGTEGLGIHVEGSGSGTAARWLTLAGALAAGLVLALVLIPHFGIWTAPGALPHHEH